MKVEYPISPVEISGAKDVPKDFKIKASPEAFRILSSGLYNDKILAIIRELSCNAYDSHVAAGKPDQPFEIHLPTVFEPWFSVKDYGVGLAHDDVLELYCTYFSSDRSDSNLFVGALGLGSKSPFCYTEGFTVTSRFNGKTRIYSAFINEVGIPAVTLLSEEDSSSVSNGLEVSFPVNQDDVWEFENKAKIALEFFNPLPIINVEMEVTKADYALKTDSWGLRKGEGFSSRGIRAIQGMVPYSVGSIDTSRLDYKQRNLYDLPLDIFFPIGELSVAASRETLSNDERTINNILNRLDLIHQGFVDEVKKKINECQHEWEARILISNAIGTSGGSIISEAFSFGKLDGVYTNFTLSNKQTKINALDYPSVVIYRYKVHRYHKSGASRQNFLLQPDPTKEVKDSFRKEYYNVSFEANESIVFVINDLNIGAEKYVRYFLNADDNIIAKDRKRVVYLISRARKIVSEKELKKEAESIIKKLGNPPCLMLSDLKYKYKDYVEPYKPATPQVRHEAFFFNENADLRKKTPEGYERKGWMLAWKPVQLLPRGRKFYLMLDRFDPVESKFDFAEDFLKFLQAVRESAMFGVTEDDIIYGVRNGKELQRTPYDWEGFMSYVFAEIPKVITLDIEEMLTLKHGQFHGGINTTLNLIKDTKPFSATHPLQIYAEKKCKAKEVSSKLEALTRVLREAEKRGKYAFPKPYDFETEWKAIQKQYPMLRLMSEYGFVSNKETIIIDYIKMVDSSTYQPTANIELSEEEDG